MAIKVKLNSNLRALAQNYRTKVEQVAQSSAEEIASLAAQLAPQRSGHLALESIAVALTASTSVFRVIAHTADSTHPEYAAFVEYGTEHSAAQPFLRPAYEFVRPRFENRLRHLKP